MQLDDFNVGFTIRAAMSGRLAPPPTEPALQISLDLGAMPFESPDCTASVSSPESSQADQYSFIATIVDLLSAASDSKVLETYRGTLKAFSHSEKEHFALLLAEKVGDRMGQSLGNPLVDNDYRRGPKLVRHYHLAGPLIMAEVPGFAERYLKAEFWRIWKWCKEGALDSRDITEMLKPLNVYAAEFATEGEKLGKILLATLEFLGKETLSEYHISSETVEKIYSNLAGFDLHPLMNEQNYLASLSEEHGIQGVSDVFLTSLRFGVPLQVVVQKVRSLSTPSSVKRHLDVLLQWIQLALNQDDIKSDQVTEELQSFLRQFAVISAGFKEPAIDYLNLKRPDVIRALFGAIWDSAEQGPFPAVRGQFILMMEIIGYSLNDGQFKDTQAVDIVPGPILYVRLGNSPVKILLFYLMVKVLRMELAVWPIIQTQARLLMQMSPSMILFYGPIIEAVPEVLEYYDTCHKLLLQSRP